MYSLKDFVWSSHSLIAEIIEERKPEKILEVGCDEGFLGRSIKYHPKYLIGVDKRLIKNDKYRYIFQLDIEQNNLSILNKEKFEVIVLADILEHLKNPGKTINKLRSFLRENGMFVISVPNIGFFLARFLNLLKIRPKMRRGLFDETHLHDFNLNSINKFLNQNGLKVIKIIYTPIPLPLLSGQFRESGYLHLIYQLSYWLSLNFPTLFSYQIIIIAELK